MQNILIIFTLSSPYLFPGPTILQALPQYCALFLKKGYARADVLF